MIPPSFKYFVPQTLSEAITLLSENGEEAKIISGGQSLIPLLKMRLAGPECLIDIGRIPDLHYIKEGDGETRIGSLTNLYELLDSSSIREHYPIIASAVKVIADPQVRNRGTLGGNICHGDPGNDLPAVMLALDAKFVVQGPKGKRTIDARNFFLGTFENALEPNEVMVEAVLPKYSKDEAGYYLKLEKRAGDYAIAGAAVQVKLNNGKCEKAGIGLTNLGAMSLKAEDSEKFLNGKDLNDSNLRQAAELVSGIAEPVDDLRGPPEYKVEMAKLLIVRAAKKAMEIIGGR